MPPILGNHDSANKYGNITGIIGSMGALICLVVAIVGIKLKWFRHRLDFAGLSSASSASSTDIAGLSHSKKSGNSGGGGSYSKDNDGGVTLAGVYRASIDYDNFVAIQPPKELPPVRITNTTSRSAHHRKQMAPQPPTVLALTPKVAVLLDEHNDNGDEPPRHREAAIDVGSPSTVAIHASSNSLPVTTTAAAASVLPPAPIHFVKKAPSRGTMAPTPMSVPNVPAVAPRKKGFFSSILQSNDEKSTSKKVRVLREPKSHGDKKNVRVVATHETPSSATTTAAVAISAPFASTTTAVAAPRTVPIPPPRTTLATAQHTFEKVKVLRKEDNRPKEMQRQKQDGVTVPLSPPPPPSPMSTPPPPPLSPVTDDPWSFVARHRQDIADSITVARNDAQQNLTLKAKATGTVKQQQQRQRQADTDSILLNRPKTLREIHSQANRERAAAAAATGTSTSSERVEFARTPHRGRTDAEHDTEA